MNRSVVTAALIVYGAATAYAQATPTVPPNDPVYDFVDRLLAAGLVDRVIVGQRPMSRREIGRILDEAKRRLPTAGHQSTWIARSLQLYASLYEPTGDASRPLRIERIGLEAVATNARARGIPPDGNGGIDVALNPMLADRLGRTLTDGTNVVAFGTASYRPRAWLVGGIGAAALATLDRGTRPAKSLAVEQAYGLALLRNVAIAVGRDYVLVGQGKTAGLLHSMNPAALDMIRLSSDRPFVLPWLFRYAGPMKGTAFIADLGPNQNFPHARLVGYRLSSRPFSVFELGAGVADQVGGHGAPPGTFLQKAADAFPLIDGLFLHRLFSFSNKLVGVDSRLRVPRVRGLQLYWEIGFDDFDPRRVTSVFTEDAGYVWGASLSCFRECGPVKVTAEYHVTGVRYYTHTPFSSGFTLNRALLGDQLGPRGKGTYLSVDIDRIRSRITFASAYEVRSGDKWGSSATTPNDSDFRLFLYEHNPAERRWRAVITASRGHMSDAVTSRLAIGAERVENFAFQKSDWRTNGLLELGVEIRPHRRPAR